MNTKTLIKTLSAGAFLVFGQTLSAQDCCDTWASCSGSGYSYGVNAPVSFADCGCSWEGRIDYLYWKPYEDGISWATAATFGFQESGTVIASDYDLIRKKIDFDWDSGFRVGLGYGFPCDKWTLGLNWTHYRTSIDKNLSIAVPSNFSEGSAKGDFTVLFPPFYPGDSILWELEDDTFISSDLMGQWKLQFNQVDLEVARSFYVGPCVSLRPHLGLSYLNINQNMFVTIEFEGSLFEERGTFLRGDFSGRYHCGYKGVGLRAGLDSNWEIVCGLGIYGEWAFNTYFGTFKTNNSTTSYRVFVEGGEGKITIDYALSDKFQALRLTNDLSVGFSWMSRFNCDKNTIFVKAGWEHHTYFGQNMFTSASALYFPVDEGAIKDAVTGMSFSNKDVYLYGFAFSASISF